MSIGAIRNAATGSAAVVLLLVAACTAPEPVVERVEVTRVVERNVEVPVTVPVTRLVEQTVEVQVNVPVTQVMEKTVEVTREVTREIPVTVFLTPTLPPTARLPTSLTPSISSAGVVLDYMQIIFTNDGGHLRAHSTPHFNWYAPELDVFVDVGLVVDDHERCETARIYWGSRHPEIICDLASRSHTTVQRASLETSQGSLICERDDFSNPEATFFNCTRSSTETPLKSIGIYFVNHRDNLRAYASTNFVLDVPHLDIFVDLDLVVDNHERCDAARIHWGLGEPEVICDLEFRSHTAVQHVSLETSRGDLQCERDDFSDAIFTSFTCRR